MRAARVAVDDAKADTAADLADQQGHEQQHAKARNTLRNPRVPPRLRTVRGELIRVVVSLQTGPQLGLSAWWAGMPISFSYATTDI